MVVGKGPGKDFEVYLIYADGKPLREWWPKSEKEVIQNVAAECECGKDFKIVLKKSPRADPEAILAENTLDGRSIGLDWGWGDGEDTIEITSMPVKEKGKKGYYALRFGELDSVDDMRDAAVKDGYFVLSRVVVQLYRGR